MYTKKLTKKEQITLWGLINYPNYNDKELAKKTRLKLSTITAIRRRLREKNYFWTVNIPNFYRLGYELLSIEYGKFNEAVPIETRTEHFQDFVNNDPNNVFSIMSRGYGIVFKIAKNYAQANESYENLEMFFTNHHLTEEEGWKRILFPFQTAIFWNFFDFSPLFRYSFDIKRKISLQEFSPEKKPDTVRLSKKEKSVMYGLVKYPEYSDNSIADRFGVSRQAVSNIKKRFLVENLISTRRIMNFENTGCDLLTFSYTFFGSRAPLDTRKNGLEFTLRHAPSFVGVSSNFENIMFAAIKSYTEYEKLREKMLSFYKTHLSIARQPEVLLFPIGDIRYYKKPSFHMLLDDLQKTD